MRILIWVLLAYLAFRLLKGRKQVREERGKGRAGAETHQDPLCGVFVAEGDAVVGVLEGKKLYFCSRECLERFREQLEDATPNQSGGKG